MTKPRLTIIAGANGSGKTTFTSDIKFFHEIPLLDPDAIGKTLQSAMPQGFPVAAARHVLTTAGEHITRGESFAVETTLSGKSYLRMMLDARKRSFEIVLVYIGTKNVETNLAASKIAFSRADTTFQKKMSGGAIQEVSRISQPPSSVRIIPFCSITLATKATVWLRFSDRLEISGSSLFPSGQQQITAPEKCPILPPRAPSLCTFCERVDTALLRVSDKLRGGALRKEFRWSRCVRGIAHGCRRLEAGTPADQCPEGAPHHPPR